jgi:hypothetical protein
VRGLALPASVLASLDATGTHRSRQIALSIREHSGTWNRIHADLTAICGPDSDLAGAARTDLLAWLQHGAATSYGQPSASQAAEIAGLLATLMLGDQQRIQIAFVAGIRKAQLPDPSPPEHQAHPTAAHPSGCRSHHRLVLRPDRGAVTAAPPSPPRGQVRRARPAADRRSQQQVPIDHP